MLVKLYSAPDEYYLEHLERCMKNFEAIILMFMHAAKRIFAISMDEARLEDSLKRMILFHDLGKLTKRWQENLGTNTSLPSHFTLGAAYLWKILPDGIKEPISFAIAIHHTDKGLLGDNIERPDVQAIIDGIVDNNGKIIWHEETDKLNNNFFPEVAKNLTINDLKEMARGLRIWAKGCALLEQHQRRIQASFAHHILKLCDISAATKRKEYQKKDDEDFYGGWLMVEEIRKYVENIKLRGALNV